MCTSINIFNQSKFTLSFVTKHIFVFLYKMDIISYCNSLILLSGIDKIQILIEHWTKYSSSMMIPPDPLMVLFLYLY